MTRMESDLNLPRRYAFGVEILNEAIFAIGSPSAKRTWQLTTGYYSGEACGDSSRSDVKPSTRA